MSDSISIDRAIQLAKNKTHMKNLDSSKFNKFNVLVFSEGNCKGQWGFHSLQQARDFVLKMKSGESFGMGVDFIASIMERKETFGSKE